MSAQTTTKPFGQGKSTVAGVAAILIGLLNVFLVIYIVATPGPQRYDAGEFFRNYVQSPLALSVAWIVLVLTAVLAYAVIPAVSALIQEESQEWVRVTMIAALAGYTVLATSFLTLLGSVPEIAQTYVAGNDVTRAAIIANGLPELDPDGWLMFGGPGLWFIVINILALRSSKLPRLQAALGILIGVGFWMAIFAGVFENNLLDRTAAGIGAVVGPVWYIWMGVRFLRTPAVS